MLVETINERGAAGATQSTVLGPFHVVQSPVRVLGDTIDLVGDGEPCVVTGQVVSVPIPTDGPVGGLLLATRRHPYRPAHIHFIATAGCYRPLTTHIFVAGTEYIDSDAVFAVKKSLIANFERVEDTTKAARYGVASPFRYADVRIALQPA